MSIPKNEKMLENVKKFAFEHFGSLKGLADAMGIKPQNLNSYIKGEVKIGPKFLYRLKSVGFNDNIDITLPKNQNVILEKKENKAIEGLDIKGAIALSNTPLERLAQLVGVAPAVLSSWQDGSATPTPTQLSTLFNLVVALGLSAQTAAKQDPPTQATA
jgi:DNA-binding transcriptional regulator YdaS (Cro superfamily)